MSAHMYSNWKVGDPISDDLVKQIAGCINANRNEENGDVYTLGAFAILNAGDAVVLQLSRCLTDHLKTTNGDMQGIVEFLKANVADPNGWYIDLAERVFALVASDRAR